MNVVDEFDDLEKYKLYRSLYEIIHPTISKKNISNYKIVLEEGLVPIRVFYPEKVSSIDSFIIYIHGIGEINSISQGYSSICKELAINTKKLVLAIDYRFGDDFKFPIPLNDCYDIVKYIYQNINDYGINPDKIIMMGDSFGGNLLMTLVLKSLQDKSFIINKQVLLSPILDNNIDEKDVLNKDLCFKVNKIFNYYISGLDDTNNSSAYPLKFINYGSYPNTLIVVSDCDPYKKATTKYFGSLSNDKYKIINMNLLKYCFFANENIEFKDDFYNLIIDFCNIK